MSSKAKSNIEHAARSFLASIDQTVWLTYEEYSRSVVSEGKIPITIDQWNILVSTAAGRGLQDQGTIDNWKANLKDKLRIEVQLGVEG